MLQSVVWATFGLTKFKLHYVVPQFFIFRRTVRIAPNFLQWNAHIFLFWLNPTGHSKFHNTSNHPPPATDSGRTARTPLYPPVQAVPPPPLLPSPPPFFFFFCCPGQRNRRRPVTVPVTGVLWMCTLNTLTLPDLICCQCLRLVMVFNKYSVPHISTNRRSSFFHFVIN